MVATRNHPRDFPEPTATTSPTKRSTRASSAKSETSPPAASPPKASPPDPPTGTPRSPPQQQARILTTQPPPPTGWAHTPSNMTLLWLAISLPAVIWDTGYVLLRPYSMPGGPLHKPLWQPYGLYGTVDHTYGFKAWEANDGWTAAQGSINAVETAAYLFYLYLVYAYGRPEARQGTGAPDRMDMLARLRGLSESRTLYGRVAALAVVVAYTTAVVTFAKTVLYWLIEAFGGFAGVGHNSWGVLFWMWIVPNGLWLVFPAYMCYVFGQELLQGLEASTASTKKHA